MSQLLWWCQHIPLNCCSVVQSVNQHCQTKTNSRLKSSAQHANSKGRTRDCDPDKDLFKAFTDWDLSVLDKTKSQTQRSLRTKKERWLKDSLDTHRHTHTHLKSSTESLKGLTQIYETQISPQKADIRHLYYLSSRQEQIWYLLVLVAGFQSGPKALLGHWNRL